MCTVIRVRKLAYIALFVIAKMAAQRAKLAYHRNMVINITAVAENKSMLWHWREIIASAFYL